MTTDLPRTADVVVVGGGVHGASVAYHLARRGARRVVLVERKFLASGPTGRSSALVRRFYAMEFLTRTANASATIFQHWAERIGGDPGFRQVGVLWLVDADRAENLRENVRRARTLGANVATQTPADVRALVPAMAVDDVALGAYEPESGYADAAMTTNAFATRARELGATVAQYVSVETHPDHGRARDRGPHGRGRDSRARGGRLRRPLGGAAPGPARDRGPGGAHASSDVLLPPAAGLRDAPGGPRPAPLDLHAPRDREPHHPWVFRLRRGRRSRPLQRGSGPRRGPEERGADRGAIPGDGARARDGRLLRRLRQHTGSRAGAGGGRRAPGPLRRLRLERPRLQARPGGRRHPGPGRPDTAQAPGWDLEPFRWSRFRDNALLPRASAADPPH